MCTFNLSIEDHLVETVRRSFPDEKALSEWMNEQMSAILRNFIVKDTTSRAKRSCGLSDEELNRLFANRPVYDDSLMPELSKEEFSLMSRSHSKKTFKNVEKWL